MVVVGGGSSGAVDKGLPRGRSDRYNGSERSTRSGVAGELNQDVRVTVAGESPFDGQQGNRVSPRVSQLGGWQWWLSRLEGGVCQSKKLRIAQLHQPKKRRPRCLILTRPIDGAWLDLVAQRVKGDLAMEGAEACVRNAAKSVVGRRERRRRSSDGCWMGGH